MLSVDFQDRPMSNMFKNGWSLRYVIIKLRVFLGSYLIIWTSFESDDKILESCGTIAKKEQIDDLQSMHIALHRVKEDAEKSVPPKEEASAEVELTILQKQHYRALHEKRFSFYIGSFAMHLMVLALTLTISFLFWNSNEQMC